MRVTRGLVAERVVVTFIAIGTLAVFALGFTAPGSDAHAFWMTVDLIVVGYYAFEQLLKMRLFGFEGYWRTRWNRFDLLVVLLSLPVFVMPMAETSAFVGVPLLRVARLFRLFRLLRFIPDHEHLGAGVRRAIRASVGVFLGIAIINFIFAMGAQILFAADAPEVYFGVAVLVGGILGLSLGNAVFVDQMMADNTEEVERDITVMTREVALLRDEIRQLRAVIVGQNQAVPPSMNIT